MVTDCLICRYFLWSTDYCPSKIGAAVLTDHSPISSSSACATSGVKPVKGGCEINILCSDQFRYRDIYACLLYFGLMFSRQKNTGMHLIETSLKTGIFKYISAAFC